MNWKTKLEENIPFAIDEQLVINFELESDGNKGKVLANDIESFDLELHPYGFDGKIHFTFFNNKEIEKVIFSAKPIHTTLTFQTEASKSAGEDPLEIKGIVCYLTSKGLGKEGKENEQHECFIYFSDAAKVSWSSHFTTKIYLEKTMKDVVDAEKNSLIQMEYDWDVLNEEHPILSFSLNHKGHLPEEKQTNFYSFLIWYLHQEGGVLDYNFKENKYKISGQKSEGGDPATIDEWRITSAAISHPSPFRFSDKKIKQTATEIENEETKNQSGFDGVTRDIFDSAGHILYPAQIPQNIKSTINPEKPLITFFVKEFSKRFKYEHLFPNNLFKIKENKKTGGEWCENEGFKDQVFRVRSTTIRGVKIGDSERVKSLAQSYELEIFVIAENKDEIHTPRPHYCSPIYPFVQPGKVFCEIGEEEQTTFNIIKDESYPLGRYQVIVPLAGEEKKIVVPFFPNSCSGQNFCPLIKDDEIELLMYFQTAQVFRVIKHGKLVELPEGTQGNQRVYESNGKDKYTYLRQEYKNGKNSVLTLKQSSSAKQTQTLEFKEKDILIVVEEKDQRKITIQLNRDSGLLLRVEDQAAGETQEIFLAEKSTTITSKGSAGTSSITLTPESIAMDTKKIIINCEEMEASAKKTIAMNASSKISLEGPVVNIKDIVKLG